MVKRATVPAVAGMALAACLGWILGGSDTSWSAAIGVAIVAVNFAAHGLSLAWASTISVSAVFAVALGGFAVRLAIVVVVMFVLDTLDPFSPVAFALAVVPSTMLLLAFEARLVTRGVGAQLEIPADPVAARAGSALASREAR